jgi:hypothetical protein
MGFVFVFDQVRIYLRWLRYVIEEVVWDRPHVILNVDETALATVRHTGIGMVSGRKRTRSGGKTRPRDQTDRFNAKTTYIGLISDSDELQPLLPQVVLPRYTQNARPPAHMLDMYASIGFPFEFWHGTKGSVTPHIVQSWATRVRSCVNSFNPSAWIVMIGDCCTSHLSVQTITHLRHLGIIIIMVPAKLTWLLQILDVKVFHPLKKDMRSEEARQRIASASGSIPGPMWMQISTSSIRTEVINRDWSAAFNKLGAGVDNRPSASALQAYLSPGDIMPALPSLEEFAELIGRPAHTDVTARIHRMIISATLRLRASSLATRPPHAA